MDLKGIELKDRDMRIKRNTRTFFKLIFVFIEDMNRFGKKKELNKIRQVKNTWYEWLISYIPESLKMCRWFKR